jgi:hypothetical protein
MTEMSLKNIVVLYILKEPNKQDPKQPKNVQIIKLRK